LEKQETGGARVSENRQAATAFSNEVNIQSSGGEKKSRGGSVILEIPLGAVSLNNTVGNFPLTLGGTSKGNVNKKRHENEERPALGKRLWEKKGFQVH